MIKNRCAARMGFFPFSLSLFQIPLSPIVRSMSVRCPSDHFPLSGSNCLHRLVPIRPHQVCLLSLITCLTVPVPASISLVPGHFICLLLHLSDRTCQEY